MKTLYQWERQAACKGMDVGLFFDHEEDQSEPAPEALAACARCPVRDSCLDEALRFEPFGVRGGFTAGGRRAIRKKLRMKPIPIHDYLTFDPSQHGHLADIHSSEVWERQMTPLF